MSFSTFREDLYRKTKSGNGIRIGYYDSLQVIPSTDGVKRAINLAKEALQE